MLLACDQAPLCGPHRKILMSEEVLKGRNCHYNPSICLHRSNPTHLLQSPAVLEGLQLGNMAQGAQQGKKTHHLWRHHTDPEALCTVS